MQKYDSYIDSRVLWIGKIPNCWNIVEISHFTTSKSGGTPDRNKKEYWEGGTIPWMSSGEINKGEVFDTNEYITPLGLEKSSAKLMPPNTVMIALNGQGKTKGMSAILKIESSCNQSLCGFNCDEKNLSYKYLYYCFQSMYKYLRSQAGDDTREGLAASDIRKERIPLPPYEEQLVMTEYLDSKCSWIENLISTQKKRVELLKEFKQSLITRAVTCGINPHVKMKDSGVEWIGKIPEQWSVVSLKYTTPNTPSSFMDGDWIEAKDISSSGIRYLTSGNIGAGYYKEQGEGFITEETFDRLNCLEVFPGDVLFSRLNLPSARSCIIPDLGYRIVTCVDNVIYRPYNNLVNKEFIVYLTNSIPFSQYASNQSRGSTMQRITRGQLGSLSVLLPPIHEQEDIVSYLNKKICPIEFSIVNAKRQIELLQEYKKALITEVVTGKRKVI